MKNRNTITISKWSSIIKNTALKNLKEGHIYKIYDSYLPNAQLEVTFSGDLNSGEEVDISCNDNSPLITNKDIIFISKKDLPVNTDFFKLPHLIFYNCNSQMLLTFRKIHIKISNGMNITVDESSACPVNELIICSDSLKKECNKLTDIPVKSGTYPIFSDKKNPKAKFIFSLFKKFTDYNDKVKLEEQKDHTDNWCAARAHFVCQLLDHYGVSSFKVFKSYNVIEWKKIYPDIKEAWGYHCATMIVDEDNTKWVWDPWESSEKYLLTLPQWLNMKNEPKPRTLLLGNRGVFTDYISGSSGHLPMNRSGNFANNFYYLFSAAVPNHPEKLLPGTGNTSIKNENGPFRRKFK